MPRIHLECPSTKKFIAGFDRIREQFQVPISFSAAVTTAAEEAATTALGADRTDLRDVALVAIDPVGSRDLDQAFHAERRGSGYKVRYAIADVGHFVAPGGLIDAEARTRGLTFYSPDRKDSLHPGVLNEDAASLLPDVDRPALMWTIDLDQRGRIEDAHIERALVRCRAARSYQEVQADLEGPSPDHVHELLREIGILREAEEVNRGGVSLNLPGQEVVEVEDHYELHYRNPRPVEGWNAQISLLTGIAAARIMLGGGVGLLRVLPPPDEGTLRWLQRSSRALGVPYADDAAYGDWVRSLDTTQPHEAALLTRAARGFRGAGYVGFDGESPESPAHAAIASPYAHVTAPLRRLIDRFGNEIVLALCRGHRPPGWVLEALDEIPEVMSGTSRHEKQFEKALVDFAEAMVLSNHVGEHFTAVVTDAQKGRVTLQLRERAVITRIKSDVPSLGDVVDVRLSAADPGERKVVFELV